MSLNANMSRDNSIKLLAIAVVWLHIGYFYRCWKQYLDNLCYISAWRTSFFYSYLSHNYTSGYLRLRSVVLDHSKRTVDLFRKKKSMIPNPWITVAELKSLIWWQNTACQERMTMNTTMRFTFIFCTIDMCDGFYTIDVVSNQNPLLPDGGIRHWFDFFSSLSNQKQRTQSP